MSDYFQVTTEDGTIEIGTNSLAKVIVNIVEEFEGKVFLSNSKGKVTALFNKFGRVDELSCMEINVDEKGIDIRVFIVIKFGTSIANTTNQIIERIYKEMERILSIPPHSVAVVVTGTISKKIAKRHIEVLKKNEH